MGSGLECKVKIIGLSEWVTMADFPSKTFRLDIPHLINTHNVTMCLLSRVYMEKHHVFTLKTIFGNLIVSASFSEDVNITSYSSIKNCSSWGTLSSQTANWWKCGHLDIKPLQIP